MLLFRATTVVRRAPVRLTVAVASIAFGLFLTGMSAVGQQLPVEPIVEVKRDGDGDLVPDRLGAEVHIKGQVTFEAYSAQDGEETRVYLEDLSAGVRLRTATPDLLLPLRRWDVVKVSGTVAQDRGMTLLDVADIEILGPGRARAPTVVTAEAVRSGEALEGSLVSIRGQPRFGRELYIADETGEARIFLRSAIVEDPVDWARFTGKGEVLVTGVVEQRGEPPDGYFRITPRSLEDVRPAAGVPRAYPYLLGGMLLATLLFATMSWYQQRHARQLSYLVEALRSGEAKLREEIGLRMLAEDARRRADEQVEITERLDSLGMLAGGFAHHFNSLLTTVLVNTELAREEPGLSDELRESLGEVDHAGRLAQGLVERLLAFGRRQVLRPEQLRLSEVVDRALPIVRRVLGEDTTVTTDLVAEGAVSVDPQQVARIILKLAANAKEAMQASGTFTVRTRDEEIGEPTPATSGVIGPGEYVVLTVEDTGPGIPTEIQGRVFEPFFTTKPDNMGTGLGLPSVLGGVRQSGGHITLSSEPGQGVTVEIFMPRAASDEAQPVTHLKVVS